MTLRSALLCLLFALVTAGCGPLPRPFAHEPSEEPSALLMLPDHAGVVVRPASGLEPAAADALAEAVVRALNRADVIASTRGGNAGSYNLEGQIVVDGDARRLVLDLVRPDGALFAQSVAPVPASPRSDTDTGRDWTAVADAAVRPIAAALTGQPDTALAAVRPDAGGPRAAAANEATIAIGAIASAPDADGNVLVRALAFALKEYNVPTVDPPRPTSHQIRGTIKITTKANNQRNLAVAWTVLAPDGTEIGKVEQANDVPLQLLRTAWSDIALAVAQGAAEGIVNVLEEHGVAR